MRTLDALKEWGISLCFVAAACAVIQFLAPKNGLGRILGVVCGAILLFSVLSPLVKVNWGEVLSFELSGSNTAYNIALQENLRDQLDEPLQQAVLQAGAEALSPYGLTAEKIEAVTDIDDDGNIYITEIVAHLTEEQAVRRVSVKQILEQRFSVEVRIEEEQVR